MITSADFGITDQSCWIGNHPTPQSFLAWTLDRSAEMVQQRRAHVDALRRCIDMLHEDILSGDYDRNYDYFLSERGEAILKAIRKNIAARSAGLICARSIAIPTLR